MRQLSVTLAATLLVAAVAYLCLVAATVRSGRAFYSGLSGGGAVHWSTAERGWPLFYLRTRRDLADKNSSWRVREFSVFGAGVDLSVVSAAAAILWSWRRRAARNNPPHRVRFRLASLLAGMGLACVGAAFIAHTFRSHERERRAIARLEDAGVGVEEEYAGPLILWRLFDEDKLNVFFRVRTLFMYVADSKTSADVLKVADAFGELHNAAKADFYAHENPDPLIAIISRLKSDVSVDLTASSVTREGLLQLAGYEQVISVEISDTEIETSVVEQLRRLRPNMAIITQGVSEQD